ncbi:MAG: hypothetical protein FJ194_11770 [Gammaproteobacteria bacterium]|nr:hypothetical protein [Gammaproteobacteria bacterium]
MPRLSPCEHLQPGRLETRRVLDEWLGVAEAIASCAVCSRDYLLELLDIDDSRRAWRLTPLDPVAARQLVHDLNSGSCDANRAAAEVYAVKAAQPPSPVVVVSEDGSMEGLRRVDTAEAQPTAHWRELSLDGGWLRQNG